MANQFIIKNLHIQEVTSGEWLLFQGKFHHLIPLAPSSCQCTLYVCSVLPVYPIMHAQITLKGTHTYIGMYSSTQCVEKSPVAVRLVCTVICEYVLECGIRVHYIQHIIASAKG